MTSSSAPESSSKSPPAHVDATVKSIPGQPQGLVHFALAERTGPTRHEVRHFGKVERGPGRLACLRTALRLLSEGLGMAEAPPPDVGQTDSRRVKNDR
jgi:hypothetical protein